VSSFLKKDVTDTTVSLKNAPSEKYMIFCDFFNHCIMKFVYESKKCSVLDYFKYYTRKILNLTEISVFSGLPGMPGFLYDEKEEVRYNSPSSVTFSSCGKYVFASDLRNTIRKICISSGQVSDFAGIEHFSMDITRNGPKEQALFSRINDLSFSPDGKFLIICSYSNNTKYIKIKN
jgi:WD40 repeat protein